MSSDKLSLLGPEQKVTKLNMIVKDFGHLIYIYMV